MKLTYFAYILLFSLASLLMNWPALGYVHKSLESHKYFFLLSFALLIYQILLVIYTLVIGIRHWFISSLIISFLNILSCFFIVEYNAFIDRQTIQNLFLTDISELGDLLSLKFYFICFASFGLTIYFLKKIKIRHITFTKLHLLKLKIVSITLLSLIINLGMFYKDYSIFLRSHREVKHLVIPANYIDGFFGYFRHQHKVELKIKSILTDARLANSASTTMVLVIGETARADHFSLYGYKRLTSPHLQQENLIKFSDVTSCGTSTGISVPCIFSHFGRDNFNQAEHRNYENLLDVFKRLGFRVIWIDNNSGCQGVCKRVEEMAVRGEDHECKTSYCHDEKLVETFKQSLTQNQATKTLYVLHMIGSHGPSYYKRYPNKFEQFKPTCTQTEVVNCTLDELINTYDNTILYTDHNLNNIISVLKDFPQKAKFLLYVSDHGESLGENNLFLHGLPFWFAPKEQKKVPLFFWASDDFWASHKINTQCLKNKENQTLSHDFLFHTVLGLANVNAKEINSNKDLTAGCKDL